MKKISIKNKFINYYKFAFLFILLFFCKGTITGDEEKVFLFAIEFLNQKLNFIEYLKSRNGDCHLYDKCKYNYLGHHLFWFVYQIFFIKIINLFFFILPQISDYVSQRIFQEILLSAISSLLIIGSILILEKAFNKYYQNCWIYISLIFLGSYGVGFVNGGFTECIAIFIISVKIYLSEVQNKKKTIYIAFLDGLLIFIKPYFALFVIIFLKNYQFKKNDYKIYFIILFFLILFFIYLKNLVPINYLNYYQKGLDINMERVLSNIYFFFFSPSVGIVFGAPFLIISIIKLKKKKIFKLIIVIFYAIFFSLYGNLSFWGGAGISGSRYIFPILIIFSKEFIEVMKTLNDKLRILTSIFLFLAFLPNLDYKNTNFILVPEQTGTLIIRNINDYPLNSFAIHPIYFSWKIFLQENIIKKENIKITINNEIFSIKSKNIMPDTFISKMEHVLDEQKFNKSDQYYKYASKIKYIDKFKENKKLINFFKIFIFSFYSLSFILIVIISNLKKNIRNN
jgi:hypothetical protein